MKTHPPLKKAQCEKAQCEKAQCVQDAPAEVAQATDAGAFPYLFRWDRKGRKGQRCRMVKRSHAQNSCLLEFEDGFQMVTSRNAVIRATDAKNSVAVARSAVARKEALEKSQSGQRVRHPLPKYPSLTDEEAAQAASS